MKKIWIILLILLTACSNNQESQYYKKIEQLEKINESSINIPFSIDIIVNKLTNMEFTYHVIIDNPLVDAKDMKVLVIHDVETNNIFPSIGIVDDKVNLIKDKVDLDKNIVKGIALVGYLPTDLNNDILFKVLIEYYDNQNNKNIVYYVSNVTLTDIK